MAEFIQSNISLAHLWPTAIQVGYGSRAEAFAKDNMLYVQFFDTPTVVCRGDLQAHGFIPQKSISPLVWATDLSNKAIFYAGHIAW